MPPVQPLDAPLPADRTPSSGLGSDVAASRLASEGPNLLPGSAPKSTAAIVRDVVTEPMFLMLLAAGSIYLALVDRGEALFLLALCLWSSASRWRKNARPSARSNPCATCRPRARW